jgi:lipopolysaccharide exporter
MDLRRTYERVKEPVGHLLRSDALRAKTMRGGAWLAGGSVAEQAVRFARNMLLARLLAPNAFGTMAIVLSSASLVDTFTDVGVRAAIIQNPRGGKASYLNASWWLGMGRAIFSYLIIFAVAPWIASFYARPELSGLLRVALLGVLFNGAISPRSALAQREMKLAPWAGITNGGGICGVILTVALSFFIRDVWALAIGYAAENAFRFLLSYVLCPGLPSRRCDWHAAGELLTFSRGVFGLALLNLLIARADIFVLARLYSSADLGLYTMAVSMVATPSVFLTNMLGQALLPALSRVQEDTGRLNRIFLEVSSWLVLLGMPAAVFISLCAPSLLTLVYGTRYVGASGPLSVASAVVFLTILNAMLTGVLFAKGRPAMHRHAVIVQAGAMLALIFPASKLLGPKGGQIAALLAVAMGYVFQLILVRSVTGLNLFRYARAFVQPALACATMLVIVLGSRRLSLILRPSTDVALSIASCVLAYAICAPAHLRAARRHESFYSPRTPQSATVPL